MIVMPLTAMIAMQYGSYFQASSHDRVFTSVTSKWLARFVDYSITFTQSCISFVMLAGAGANLNQQWGLPTWVGSIIMAVAVIGVSLLNVDKVTNVLGSITPFITALLFIAAIATFINPPHDFASAAQFANDTVSTSLPNWFISSVNYIGIALMGGISMGIVMGGDTLDMRSAGRGGVFGGLLFGIMLVVMVATMIFNAPDVYQESLPTLAIIAGVHPWLGTFASFIIYLMIFSTALGNFYSLGRRLTVSHPRRFFPVLVILVVIGFALSFLDFATLVGSVFPIMGYVAIVMIAVLFVSWMGRGRGIVTTESRRRDKILSLVLRMVDPKEKFTTEHRRRLSLEIFRSNISDEHLRETIVADVVEELDADDSNDFSAEDFELDPDWIDGSREELLPGQVRIVDESVPVAQGEEPRPPKAPESEDGQEESVLVDDEGWGVVDDSEVREFIDLEHPAKVTTEETEDEETGRAVPTTEHFPAPADDDEPGTR